MLNNDFGTIIPFSIDQMKLHRRLAPVETPKTTENPASLVETPTPPVETPISNPETLLNVTRCIDFGRIIDNVLSRNAEPHTSISDLIESSVKNIPLKKVHRNTDPSSKPIFHIVHMEKCCGPYSSTKSYFHYRSTEA